MEKNTKIEPKKTSVAEITAQLKGYKDTAVREFKETRLLVRIILNAAKQYLKTKDFDLNKDDKEFIKHQSADILKLLPLIVLQIFPGSTIATPFIVKLGEKLGIKLNSKIPKKYQEDKEEETDGELGELVDRDGTIVGSNIPLLQQDTHPSKTLDQTVRMSRTSQFPFIRVYYGESEEKGENIIDEVDYSEAFAYDETEDDKTYDDCMKTMEEMGVEDFLERDERCKKFGFDKNLDKELKGEKKQGECKNCFTKRRLSELEKEKMNNLLDEILLSKKKKSDDVIKKDGDTTIVTKIIKRNLDSIKAIADKEGISVDKLVKYLKNGEQQSIR